MSLENFTHLLDGIPQLDWIVLVLVGALNFAYV